MKIIRKFSAILTTTGSLFFVAASAGAVDVNAVILKIQDNLAPQSVEAHYKFTNYRLDKSVSVNEIVFKMRDVNHSHGTFVKPERERGREILRNNDTLWTFVPSVGRAVRIIDRDSFAGGDFSNADVLRADWLDKYTATLAKDTSSQWIIDLTAKTKEAAYAKMRVWVDKKSGQPVQQLFFDSQGTKLKRCQYATIKTFGPITRPTYLLMENLITGQKSELEVVNLEKKVSLPESRFVVESLGK